MSASPVIRTPPARRNRAEFHERRSWLSAGVVTLVVASALVACGAERPVLSNPDPRLRAATTAVAAATTTTTRATTSRATRPTRPTSRATTTSRIGKTTTPKPPAPVQRAVPVRARSMHGLVATPIGAPVVYKSATLTSAVIPVPRINGLGVATVFAVIGDDSKPWIQVLLPTRPNGATGWVQRSKVRITATDVQLVVDLSRRLLTVNRANHAVMKARVAIGSVTNPTPTGATYITELLDTGKPNGAYGPFAFGLALHSNTLTEFEGGNGQVAIHGTNSPTLIGQRVSHGCVRLNNADVLRLVSLKLALGTPVFIY